MYGLSEWTEGRWMEERRQGDKEGGMLEGGVKYVRRVAGKKILISGMCIRVWPKQIHCQTFRFE